MSELSEGATQSEPFDSRLRLPLDSPGAVWTPSLWRLLDGGSDPKGPPLVLEPRKRRALGQQRVKVGQRWEKSLPDMGLPEPIAAHLGSRDRMSVNTFLALAHSSPVSERIVCVCDPQDLRNLQERLTKHADSLAWLLLRAQDLGGEDLCVLLLDEEQRRSLVTVHDGASWTLTPYGKDVVIPCWVESGEVGKSVAGPWVVPGSDVGVVTRRVGAPASELSDADWSPGQLGKVVTLGMGNLVAGLRGKSRLHPWVDLLRSPDSSSPLFICSSSSAGFKYAPGVGVPGGVAGWKSGDWIQVVRVTYSEGFEEFTAPGVLREVPLPRCGPEPAVPGAPLDVSVLVRNGCAVVRFVPGCDGSAPVDRYEYSLDAGSTWLALDGGGTPGDRTITGLGNGVMHKVRVRAVNAVGPGPGSLPVLVVPSAEPAVPATPRDVSVVVGDGCAVVRFVPGCDGSAPVDRYEYSLDVGSTWLPLDGGGAPGDRTITGLGNGVTYEVRVRAVNAVGPGPGSLPVLVVPSAKLAVPDPPRVVSVVVGDGCAVVRFVPGSDDSIRVDRYEYSLDMGSTWLPLDGGGAPGDRTITGLRNGVTYEVRVRAVNAVGPGPGSLPVLVMPSAKPAVPDPPRIVSVVVGDGCAVVRFVPGSDGSIRVDRYEYSLDVGSTWEALDGGGGPGDPTITGLANGVMHEVRVRAVNAVGPGPGSLPVLVMPSEEPAIPPELGVDRALRLATGTEIGELIELRRATKVQTVSPGRSSILSAMTGNDVDRRIGRSWRSFVSALLVLCAFAAFAAGVARHEESGYVGFLLIWAGAIASGVLFAVLLVRLLLGPRLWSALIEVLLPTKKVMAAVQPASPTFAERNCIVLDEDALSLIGVKSGEEVRLHSVVGLTSGEVSHRIKSVKAHAPTDSELERRRRLVGGGRHAPIPSAEASLGMTSQLPWAWIEADIRDSLGFDGNVQLQAVIVEPSRRFAFIDSLAEFAIVSALAAVGAITVLFPDGGPDSQPDAYTPDGGAVATFGILIAIPFFFLLWRLRRRLK